MSYPLRAILTSPQSLCSYSYTSKGIFCNLAAMVREILENKRKALKINLDETIYGTFAEIGAGQEVARNFFTAGAASGTIA